MLQRRSGLVLVLLLWPSTAIADMGPPPGLKRAKTVNRVASAADLRDHVLIVVHHRTHFANKDEPQRVAKIVTLPTDVTGHYRQSAELVIVPRALANEFPDPLDLAEAAKTRRGAARFPLSFDEDVPAWYGEEFTVNQRLERDESSGEFRLVRESWRPYKQCCVVLVAIPLAFVSLGFRFIRRTHRRRAASHDTGSPPNDSPTE